MADVDAFGSPANSEPSGMSWPGALLMLLGAGLPALDLVLVGLELMGSPQMGVEFDVVAPRLLDSTVLGITSRAVFSVGVVWAGAQVWAGRSNDRVYLAMVSALNPLLVPACLVALPVVVWAWIRQVPIAPPSQMLQKTLAGVTMIGLVLAIALISVDWSL